MLMRAATVLCNSCASLTRRVLSFIACFILLVIAPLPILPFVLCECLQAPICTGLYRLCDVQKYRIAEQMRYDRRPTDRNSAISHTGSDLALVTITIH